MTQYLLPMIASVLLLGIFMIIRVKIRRKLVLKVIAVSLLNVIFFHLLYTLYSLMFAVVALIVLTVAFSYIVGKQELLYQKKLAERKKAAIVSKEEKTLQERNKQAFVTNAMPMLENIDQPKDENEKRRASESTSTQLDQESIDAIINAAVTNGAREEGEEESEKEEETFHNDVQTLTTKEETVHNDGQTLETDDETIQDDSLILPQLNNVTFSQNELQQEESEITIEIEEALKEFLADQQPMGKHEELNNEISVHDPVLADEIVKDDQSNLDELYEIDVEKNEVEFEGIFEGRSREFLFEEESDEKEEDQEANLVILDRGLINEIEEPVQEVESEVSKAMEPEVKDEEKRSELKESILQKRTKLFEELEKDL